VITSRPAPTAVKSRDMNAAWRHVDLIMCVLVGLTCLVGTLMVYSATRTKPALSGYVDKHIMFIVIGIGVAALVASFNYERLRALSPMMYLVVVAMLVAVWRFARPIKGIRAWFELGPIQIQPAELAKFVVIVLVATYLGSIDGQLKLRHLITSLVMFAIPMGLIMLQPDLGTNLVFVMIAAGMLVCAGFPLRYIVTLVLVVVVGVVAILNSDTLEDYQRDRLTSFASADSDSYNTRQSQTAISLGGLAGAGYLQGEYTKGGSVPEQQTDFIFTVSGEEFGFLGSSVLLLLLAGIIWRVWRTAQVARDRVGSLMCIGVLCLFMFHVFENVGMSLGIMPVTGIPLPFVSYGGSAMITAFACVGLVQNVHMRRYH